MVSFEEEENVDPLTIDFIIYAPESLALSKGLEHFSNAKLIQSLWAGVDRIVHRCSSLRQPLARMVEEGMTKGMVQYVTCHLFRHLLRNYV